MKEMQIPRVPVEFASLAACFMQAAASNSSCGSASWCRENMQGLSCALLLPNARCVESGGVYPFERI